MTKKTLNYTLIVLLLSILTITNWSCEKIFGDDSVEENITLSQDKTQVTPFEIVTITAADYTFSNDVYYATIADKDIELRKTTDIQLMFMMPYITSGNHKLIFTIDDIEYNIEFDINSPEPIDNPDEVIEGGKQKIITGFNKITFLNEKYNLQVPQEDIDHVTTLLSEFDQEMSQISDSDKQQLASYMNANPDLFDYSEFDFSLFNDSLNTTRDSEYWDKQLTRDAARFTIVFVTTVVTIEAFVATLAVPSFVTLIGAAAIVVEVNLLIAYKNRILNNAYMPHLLALNENKSRTIEYSNNEEYIMGIDASYRTLYKNDQSQSGVLIDFVANINTLSEHWNDLTNKIPSLSSSTITNLSDKNSYVINQYQSSVSPQYISIKNISNSNVTVSHFPNIDAVRVTFTTSAEEDQDFTFDIVYKNPDFSEERITVSATLIIEKPAVPCPGTPTVTDVDGNVYNTVLIGDQCWMAENLNTGIDIIGTSYDNGIIEKECYNDNYYNCVYYGGLYDWNEMMQYVNTEGAQGICPSGWHIPTNAEWKTMEMQLGMTSSEAELGGWRGTNEGGKLKETGTAHWQSPNEGATNLSGFTALGAGHGTNNNWGNYNTEAAFWTSTEGEGLYYAYMRRVNNDDTRIYMSSGNGKGLKYSVRCIKN